MPVFGGTTLKLLNAVWPQRRNAYLSPLRLNSISLLCLSDSAATQQNHQREYHPCQFFGPKFIQISQATGSSKKFAADATNEPFAPEQKNIVVPTEAVEGPGLTSAPLQLDETP